MATRPARPTGPTPHLRSTRATRPPVLGLLKQKGGVGGTTVTVHLALAAAAAGRRVAILDVDPQASALAWARGREAAEPAVAAVAVEQLDGALDALAEDGVDLVLVDTPPHHGPTMAAVARRATLALVPTRASAFDLAALPATLDLVQATEVPALVILNACPSRGREVAEARQLLAQLVPPTAAVWAGQLGDRVAFRRTVAAGLTVLEAEPKGTAAAEVRALWDTVAAHLALLTFRA